MSNRKKRHKTERAGGAKRNKSMKRNLERGQEKKREWMKTNTGSVEV